ncbi:hypothetical protein BOS5A_10207 [Bosea sp. EC-HK365B]|nr:hypothetical protein BOSE21B_10864 [Bosea sp. 21B]CAD5262821.1 hypothetical protein BOSE7B_150272 [Bosea sp. 7B]VVT43801.1 hypothetical protein BOS5A_10207 [Bosea sp. EC-HK365B]VXC36396.1 hypothetical protein BOSE127_180273 [Bosea sp. 127]
MRNLAEEPVWIEPRRARFDMKLHRTAHSSVIASLRELAPLPVQRLTRLFLSYDFIRERG